MKPAFKFRIILKFLTVIIFSQINLYSWADKEVNPIPKEPPPAAEGFLLYKPSSNEKSDTYQFLNKQDSPNQDLNSNAKNYDSGKSRAQQMVGMLQNQELTKAFQKITASSNKTLDENPELKNPLGVIIGAASFWYGQTLKLIKGNDFKFSARIEGRSRQTEFSMTSPLLNGRLKFDANNGMGVGLYRNLSELQAETSIQYNSKEQTVSTEVRKKIAPNLDLSFGASRLDQNTKVEYRLNF